MDSVTTYYLEMKSAASLKEKSDAQGLEIREVEIKQFEFNRFLYVLVGSQWQWTGRLSWSDQQWKSCVEVENHRTWVAYMQGTPAGYFELQRAGREVEILYFGLAPRFTGRGLGGYMLSEAIKLAWDWQEPERVWVHTCSLDHEYALANYKARGMQLYRVETEQ